MAEVPIRLAAIDEQIHDLLMRRAALVARHAAATPARQAMMLRRLAARHAGTLPLAGLVRIWCEIVAWMSDAALQVHVFAGDEVALYRDLARAYFGSAAAMEGHASAAAVIHACAGDPAAFGLLPPPDSDEKERPWWALLTPSGQRGPRVVARLPLVYTGTPQASGFAIGSLEQEPTGDDTSMIILEAHAALSRTKLQTVIKQAGLDAQLVAVGRDSAASPSRLHLLEIAGFVASDDSRLGSLQEQAGDAIVRLVSVGGYANSIRQPRSA